MEPTQPLTTDTDTQKTPAHLGWIIFGLFIFFACCGFAHLKLMFFLVSYPDTLFFYAGVAQFPLLFIWPKLFAWTLRKIARTH